MIQFQTEQRMKRSDIAQEALELQLEATAERAKFSSLVLADELGLVMAKVGDLGICEEMAAMSPKLVQESHTWDGKVFTKARGRIRLFVSTISSTFGSLYLCAAGGLDSTALHELSLSGRGVDRILA